MIQAAIFVIFPLCMAYAAVSDMLSMTIPNRISILLVASFILIAPLAGMAWTGIGWHLAAGALVLAATFALFALGAMGGGDAKLIPATAVWMGLGSVLLEYLVYTALAGGLLALAIVLYRKSPLAVMTGHMPLLRNFADSRLGIPYGVALAIGGLAAFPSSALVLMTQ